MKSCLWKWEFMFLCLIFHTGRAIKVDMSNKNLRTVPQTIGSNVTELNLGFNTLEVLDDYSFRTFVELVGLNLIACSIRFIYNGTFAMQGKLETLSLRQNRIQHLPWDFGPPTDSLLYLNVFDAFAPNFDLKPYYFSAFKQLEELRVGSWKGITFSNANIPIRLQILKITYSFKVFPDVSNRNEIHTLSIWDNKFSFIPDGYMEGMHALKELSIGRNNLERIPNFSYMINLELLRLPSNSIVRIPRDAIKGLRQLRVLWLQNNKISVMPNISLLPSLQTVELDNNLIPSVPQSTLHGLPQLLGLKLRGNIISYIEVSSLFMSNNLFLGGSQFSNLPDLIDTTLDRLFLSGNPFFCNQSLCSLRMWPWFKTIPPDMDNPVCTQPPYLSGISVMRVHPVLLQCYNGKWYLFHFKAFLGVFRLPYYVYHVIRCKTNCIWGSSH